LSRHPPPGAVEPSGVIVTSMVTLLALLIICPDTAPAPRAAKTATAKTPDGKGEAVIL